MGLVSDLENVGCSNSVMSIGCTACTGVFGCENSKSAYYCQRIKDSHRAFLCFGNSPEDKRICEERSILNVKVNKESFQKHFTNGLFYVSIKNPETGSLPYFTYPEKMLEKLISEIPELKEAYPTLGKLYEAIPQLSTITAFHDIFNSDTPPETVTIDGKKFRTSILKRLS